MDCIFCKIIKGEIPCTKVYEDEEHLSFLDIAPANKGHCLVIPKKHSETTLDMNKEELCRLIAVVNKVTAGVVKALKPDGYNLFVNNKKAAGQLVPHVHFHIVPRFKDDGHKFDWEHKKYEDGEAEEFRERIKNFL